MTIKSRSDEYQADRYSVEANQAYAEDLAGVLRKMAAITKESKDLLCTTLRTNARIRRRMLPGRIALIAWSTCTSSGTGGILAKTRFCTAHQRSCSGVCMMNPLSASFRVDWSWSTTIPTNRFRTKKLPRIMKKTK